MFKAFATIFRPTISATNDLESVDAEIKRYSDSLETKRKVAIEKMGSKWLFHPDHKVLKKDIGENSLGFKTV